MVVALPYKFNKLIQNEHLKHIHFNLCKIHLNGKQQQQQRKSEITTNLINKYGYHSEMW